MKTDNFENRVFRLLIWVDLCSIILAFSFPREAIRTQFYVLVVALLLLLLQRMVGS